jgi:hypothetical protein
MKSLFVLSAICLLQLNTTFECFGQTTVDSLSIHEIVRSARLRSIEYTPGPLAIDMNNPIVKGRGFYIYSANGIYEQYNLSGLKADLLRPYKGHYPAPGFSLYMEGQYIRDSFNPHGANSIGSALLNGVINGLLFGNKY